MPTPGQNKNRSVKQETFEKKEKHTPNFHKKKRDPSDDSNWLAVYVPTLHMALYFLFSHRISKQS